MNKYQFLTAMSLAVSSISFGSIKSIDGKANREEINNLPPTITRTDSTTDEFVIKGMLAAKHNKPQKIYLTYMRNGHETKDSCVLNKGSFEFNGKIDGPIEAQLQLLHPDAANNNDDIKNIWIEAGEMNITGTDLIDKATITGSKLNDDQLKLDGMLKIVIEKEQRVQDTFVNDYAKDAVAANKHYDEGLRQIFPERLATIVRFNKEVHDSYLNVTNIASILTSCPDDKVLDSLFTSLPDKVKATPKGKELGTTLKEMKIVGIGVQAPLFSSKDVDGKVVNLSDFKGKYVFLDFWASWCVPCRAESPDVVKAYNKFKDKGFAILGISLDDAKTREAWKKAIIKDGLNWTQVSNFKGWEDDIAKLYVVRSIPFNFLIDPEGKIVAKGLHGDNLNATLEKYIH